MDCAIIKCTDCDKSFDKTFLFKKHRKVHDKPYPCALCHRRFSLNSGLKRHKKTHLQSRPTFKCPYPRCEFRKTLQRSYLLAHLEKSHASDEDLDEVGKLPLDNHTSLVEQQQLLQGERNLEFLESISRGDKEEVENFLSDGASATVAAKTSSGSTALHLSIEKGHHGFIDVLLQSGIDVNAADKSNNTALGLALRHKQLSIAQMLVDSGAHPNLISLPDVASEGQYECVEFLLRCRADIHASNSKGETALHTAALNGHEPLLRLLIQNKANLQLADLRGRTALHNAAEGGYTGVARQLLAKVARANSLDNEQNTPLHYASREGHVEIAHLLLAKGASTNSPNKLEC
ncbi:ankyrin repeat-containing domain protein, partial [Leptodontidium sp. MPI-SDFR-AT-0119]